jgi:Ca2+:H+ antiporter
VRNPLNLLLLFLPLALLAQHLFHAPPLVVFAASALAIVPLAKWMGTATEELSARTGPGIGGLLNASFGNATELIIALFAIQAGLLEVVKASITGSIIGNILFVLGLAMVMGGLGRESQSFNRTAASAAAAQLTLATIALIVPATFAAAFGGGVGPREFVESEFVAALLIVSYGLSLLFSLRTHAHLYSAEAAAEHGALWSVRQAVGVLAAATLGVALMAELLVHSVEGVTHELGWSELFIGVIVIPVIGNAAEHLTAVTVALKNKMDLSLGIALGSSTQVALLIAPLLVFASLPLGQPMNLLFGPVELVAIASAVLIANIIALDGESNWFEGAQLLIAYAVLGVAFFTYIP